MEGNFPKAPIQDFPLAGTGPLIGMRSAIIGLD